MIEEHLIDEVTRERLADAFVVVSEVHSSTGEPQFRRRVHLSLTAAQRTAQRAKDRGLQARVVLCTIRPLDEILTGAESHHGDPQEG
ncbi:hypothetical protein [Nesterenkonia sp. CF4.4]|uniref:hypothetical protein n=1 Tax=Nesterenkonia sp. CF4.4 TaxID=3373079 RepID=UPI003EE6C9B6